MKIIAALLMLACLCATRDAAAEIVKDGPLSMDVRGADVCVISPVARRSGAHCGGLDVPSGGVMEASIEKGGARLVSGGFLRAPHDGARIGTFQIIEKEGASDWTDQRAADDFARQYAKGMESVFPAGTTTRVSDVRVIENGDTRVVRATFDFDGIEPGAPAVELEHEEVAAIFTRTAMYVVMIVGPHANEAALRNVATETASTIALDASARPTRGKDLSELVGRLVVFVAIIIVAGATYLSSKRM